MMTPSCFIFLCPFASYLGINKTLLPALIRVTTEGECRKEYLTAAKVWCVLLKSDLNDFLFI